MKKNIFKTATIIASSIAILFCIIACEVGLGAAVDTAAPTVDIAYPPKNAVIRESFIVTGSCDDDLELDNVQVTVTNSENKNVYGPYTADLDSEKKAWTITLNQKTQGNYDAFNAYKQWEFPDGSYIISVVSYDKVGNASQEASIPVDVDNTAPVLIVSKPLAVGAENASVYGRTLNIIGDISEAHETTKLTLNYMDAATSKVDSLEINGFGTMSSDNPLVIAKLDKSAGASTLLAQNYEKIYDATFSVDSEGKLVIPGSFGKKTFYCGFLLEDSAKVYTNAGDSGSGDGNQTTQYYILSDTFNDELFKEDKYSLNARNLMLLLNGQSSYSATDIEKITNELKKTGNTAFSSTITEAQSSKFSIDPKSSPTWAITNFDFKNGTFDTYEAGSAVPLVLKAGGDGIAVDKDSIEIRLYHLGNGEVPGTISETTPYTTLVRKGEYEDGKLKTALNKEGELDFSDGSKSKLLINHYYEFVVTGKDGTDNSIESENGRYGFRLYSSYASPKVTFEKSLENNGFFEENKFYSGTKLTQYGIKIRGTVVTANSSIKIENKDKIRVSGITRADTSSTAAAVSISDSDYSYTITDFAEDSSSGTDGKTYNFTALITGNLVPSQEAAYKYKVGFVAEDELFAKNESSEFEFKVDNKAPEIPVNEITVVPTVTDGKDYVNGIIEKITGSVSDVGSGFSKLYYKIDSDDFANAQEVTDASSPWTIKDIDTTTLDDESEHTIYLYAVDSVGNYVPVIKKLNVWQETDRPKISFTNDSTIFTKTSNTLVGNITDDDGLTEISATYRKVSPEEESTPHDFPEFNFTQNTTSVGFNLKLPDAEGEYEISFKIKDKAGLDTGKLGYDDEHPCKISVKKDNGAPEFKITSPNSTAQTYYNDAVLVKGTAKDGSGIVTIKRNIYKVVNDNQTKVGDTVTLDGLGTAAEIVADKEWTDSIPKQTLNGTYKVVYTAEDKYASTNEGHTSTQTLNFSIDITPPVISNSVKLDGSDISSGWYKKNSGNYTVTATDVGSRVVSVSYSKDNSAWVSMSDGSAANTWESSITFDDAATAKTLYFKASDAAGNESEVKSINLQIDVKAPTLTVLNNDGTVLGGNKYVNKKNDFEFKGNFTDGVNESGISKLEFKIGEETITNKVTVIYNKDAEGNYDGTYTAKIAKAALADGMLTVTGTDIAGNKTEKNACTFILDTIAPVINIESLIMVDGSDRRSAYKDSTTGKYYIRNTKDGKLTIKGTATEQNEFEKIVLSITGAGESNNISEDSENSSWEFANINLSGTAWSTAGEAIVHFTATDSAGNSSDEEFNLVFDETKPKIETGECPDARYTFRGASVTKFNNLSIGQGNYSESSYGRLTAIKIEAFINETGSGLSKLEYRLYDADGIENLATLKSNFANGTGSWAASGTFTLTKNQTYSYFDSNQNKTVSGTGVKASTSISGFKPTTDGKTNYLLLRPIDNCGNAPDTNDITVLSVHVDQTAPTIVATRSEQLTNGTKEINLSGTVYDLDAGLKALRVFVDGEAVIYGGFTTMPYNASKDKGDKELKAAIDNGLIITAKDKDGNEIDLGTNYSNLTDASGNPNYEIFRDAVEVSFQNDYGIFTYKGYAPENPDTANPTLTDKECSFANAASYARWTLTLTPKLDGWFKDYTTQSNPVVSISAEDWAEHDGKGNIAPNATKIATLTIDKTPPEVKEIKPEPRSETKPENGYINGEVSITGKASDVGSNPETLELYYSKAATVPTEFSDNAEDAGSKFVKLQSISTKGTNAVNVSQLYNFSFTEDFYDSKFIDEDERTKDILILIRAIDEAGNKSTNNSVKYTIDRNTDRPVVTISDQDLTGMTSADSVYKLLKEKKLYINITDDDGLVKEAKYRIKNSAGTVTKAWTPITLNSGSGSLTLDDDGKQIIEFYVKDANDSEFSPEGTYYWNKVVIEDSADTPNKFGLAENEVSAIYATLDTTSPEISEMKIAANNDTDFTAADSFDTILGGSTKKIRIKVKATDSGSGIDTVEAVVKLGENEVADSPYAATPVTGETDTYLVEIPCSDGSGVLNVKLVAKDKAGREGSAEKQFDIDNKKPRISVSSPKADSEQSGTIYAIGSVDESVELYYAVSPISDSPDKYETLAANKWKYIKAETDEAVSLPAKDKYNTGIEPRKELKELCNYKQYYLDENNKLVSTFNIQFDGKNNASVDHTANLNGWLMDIGITTDKDLTYSGSDQNKLFTDYVRLYLHLKAKDAAGNKTELVHPIVVDPQGNRPKVQFTYPAEDNAVLGDRINIIGSATGTNPVDTVYMQIDTNPTYNSATGKYTWNGADYTDLTVANGYAAEDIVQIPLLASGERGIKISVNGTIWSRWINTKGEFNPPALTSGSTETENVKPIMLRLYAYDSQSNLLSSAKTKVIKIDDDVPVIDQNIMLVQWNDSYDSSNGFVTVSDFDNHITLDTNERIQFKTGAVKALRNYKDGMYVKGKWYVVGKVSDKSGISTVKKGGEKGVELSTTKADDGSIIRPYIVTKDEISVTNYIFCFPVGSEDGVGSSEVLFYAKDNGEGEKAKPINKTFTLNYDNKPPVVTSVSNDYKEILNTNGLYFFESEAEEATVENNGKKANQSGVERVAFYFTREITKNGKTVKTVFDPMIRSKKNGADVDGNAVTWDTSLVEEDGLLWKKFEAVSISNSVVTGSSIASDKNIHNGGLAKINGTIYRITKDNAGITLPDAPDSTSTTVLFAIANVIDDTVPEDVSGEFTRVKNDYAYGYPTPQTDFYDDGDNMPEHFKITGSKCTWDASINSANISDGPVTLHYVVFDAAGNSTEKTLDAMVQNNSPRIAGIRLGTDENGNGTVDDTDDYTEFVNVYKGIFDDGYIGAKKAIDVTIPSDFDVSNSESKAALKVKRNTVIQPEVIGGNGEVGYTYKVYAKDANGTAWANASYSSPVTGTWPKKLGIGNNGNESDEKMTLTQDSDGIKGIRLDVADILNATSANGIHKFEFKIWDSTTGLIYGQNSQKATLNVIMDVLLYDETPATNKIIPFYWKSAEENSLADNSMEKGHIELSKDLYAITTGSGDTLTHTFDTTNGVYTLNPKVSGAIKLEGIAQDNSLLRTLYVKIGSTTHKIADYVSVANVITGKTKGEWVIYSDTSNNKAWSASVRAATYDECVAAGYIESIPEGKNGDETVDETSQDYGHVVHWTMTIDTEKMPGMSTPNTGVTITVSAEDAGRPNTNGTAYTKNTFNNNDDGNTTIQTGGKFGDNSNVGDKYTCWYTVDVVPYIRGIKTALSKKSKKADTSEYDRTSLGHYPVKTTETIYVYGFNLARGKLYRGTQYNNNDPYVELSNTSEEYEVTKTSKIRVYPTTGNVSGFTSGPVYVRVGNVYSLNNENNNDAQGIYGASVPQPAEYGSEETYSTFGNFYNRQPNDSSNYSLTDDVWLDVWEFNDKAAKPANAGNISDPIMKINPANKMIGFAYQSGARRFSMANGNSNSYQLWVGDYDNLSATGFAYDSDGNTYGTALGGDINSAPSVSKFVFLSSLWEPAGTGDGGALGGGDDNSNKDNAMQFEQIGQLGTKAGTDTGTEYIDKFRFVSPSIAVSGKGTTAKVYMAYYDKMNKEIRFRWAANPKKQSGANAGFLGKSYIKDRYLKGKLGDNASVKNASNVSVDPDNYCLLDFQIIAGDAEGTTTSLGKPGSYVALDVIPKGAQGNNQDFDVVVMVWYDESEKNLKYTYNVTNLENVPDKNFEGTGTAENGTKTQWKAVQTIFSDAGQYCQIKTDAKGGIHIAAYDSNAGDICYAKLATYNTGYDESTMSCVVDSNGIVGSNLTLDVAYNDTPTAAGAVAIPYLGYYGSIGPKMAVLTEEGAKQSSVSAAPGTVEDMFTGYWDVTEIPTTSNAPKDRVNVGVWKDGGVITTSSSGASTHAGAGTTSNDGKSYGNGTNNPVVAYEIRPTSATGYMETAQKK